MAMCPRKTTLVKGGDHNSQVGGGAQRDGVGGKFGLCTATNEAGEDLLHWCEANNQAFVNSFMKQHQNRGTSFTYIWRRWYELNGFIMRQDQRQRKVKKMATIRENSISDHRPKTIWIKTNKKACRHAGRGESVRRVN